MKKFTPKGFTLIELAVALTIVALVIGGLAVPMSKRLAEQQYTDTQATLDKAVEALVGYAVLNGRLPCPDMDTNATAVDNRNGAEDRNVALTGCHAGVGTNTNSDIAVGAAVGASWGDLPWQTLGLSSPNNADAWNNRLRYAVVTRATADPVGGVSALSGMLGTTLQTYLDIRCGNPANVATYVAAPGCLPAAAGPLATNFVVNTNAVFVVYSLGANGWGSTPITSLIVKSFAGSGLATTTDQAANLPELTLPTNSKSTPALRSQFVTRARTDKTSNSGEFDDLLTYMSSNTLAAKLLNAGVYP
jgi:prepilin-type N-terminal cleavage/methylation domain-containing protein